MKKEISVKFDLKKSKEVTFHVKSKGRKMGRLEVAEKGIKWFPANNRVNAKIEIKWENFIRGKDIPDKTKIITCGSDPTYTRPVGFIFDGVEYNCNSKSWKDLFVDILNILYDEDRELFWRSLEENSLKYSRSKYYMNGNKRIKNSNLKNGYYLKINSSAEDLLRIICKIIKSFGYNRHSLKIKVEERK